MTNSGTYNNPGNTVSVIDTATNKVVATVKVGTEPYGVSVTPDGTKAYIVNFDSSSFLPRSANDNVSVIDTATNKVIATVNVGRRPSSFGLFIGSLNIQPVLPVANFTSNVTSGKAPLTFSFKDKSNGSPTSWKWSFGDGSTKTSQNPVHTYSKAGSYTVKLTVTNAAGSNTTTKTNYIKVIGKPVAVFSATPTSGKAPLSVKFTDKSTGSPTSWKWSFGDGAVKTSQNPTHMYSKAGNYTVKLTVTNVAGSNSKTVSNCITVK